MYYYRCCCGNSYTHHCGIGADVQSYNLNNSIEKDSEQWSVGKNTCAFPTDAYGTIEFQGGPHPTKAQVSVRYFLYYQHYYCTYERKN